MKIFILFMKDGKSCLLRQTTGCSKKERDEDRTTQTTPNWESKDFLCVDSILVPLGNPLTLVINLDQTLSS